MSDVIPKPPPEWLQHLHDGKQWERLIEMAGKSLAAEPDDPVAHRHIAWGYAKLDRPHEMRPHVEFLLRDDPEDPKNHHLAAIYFLEIKQNSKAKPHIDLLLADDPKNATYHYLACIFFLRTGNSPQARRHIQEARALCPEWATAAHLEISMDGTQQLKAREAWNRIRRLEETLALDPENAAVMKSIGTIYLNELELPRDAERLFRQALFITPADKELQKLFLDAIRARSLVYRTLSLPVTFLRTFHRGFRPTFGVLWVLFAYYAIIPLVAWLLIVGSLFIPAAKIFEWLVLSEITRVKHWSRLPAPLAKMLAWPVWVRLGLAVAIIVGAWLMALGFFVPTAKALEIIAWIFGVHFVLMALVVGLRKVRTGVGRWREARRHQRNQQQTMAQAEQ